MRQPQLLRHMARNRRRTVALGRMVPAGQECDAHLARIVDLRFGNLAGDEGIRPGGNRGLEIALCPARAPGDVSDRACDTLDERDRLSERLLDVRSQGLRIGKGLAIASCTTACSGADRTAA